MENLISNAHSMLSLNQVTTGAAALLLAVFLLRHLRRWKHDAREPPLVSSSIPLIGHGFGLFLNGSKYFRILSTKIRSEIFTVRIWNQKLYVVASGQLAKHVFRNSKSFNFNPYATELGLRLTGASDAARAILRHCLDTVSEKSDDNYVVEMHDRTMTSLSPSSDLANIAVETLNQAWTDYLAPLYSNPNAGKKVRLHQFLRNLLTVCTTEAIYGPENPFFKDRTLVEDFWHFDRNVNVFLVNMCPNIIAPRAFKARTRMARAFERYFSRNGSSSGSVLAKERYSVGSKYGFRKPDMGHMELGVVTALLVNTVPTAFYYLMHIFRSPGLLSQLRHEVDHHAITRRTDERGHTVETLNLDRVRRECTLLNSTLHEVLRLYSEIASARLVLEDTLLDNTHLLTRNAIVQIPNTILHQDGKVWGDTSFRPDRFIDSSEPRPRIAQTLTSSTSYRPFGGGNSLCPGRHYAAIEMAGLAALMIWKFDLRAVGEGRLEIPTPRQQSVVEGVSPPGWDVEVDIQAREDGETGLEISYG